MILNIILLSVIISKINADIFTSGEEMINLCMKFYQFN
jgi:hypothetical protein